VVFRAILFFKICLQWDGVMLLLFPGSAGSTQSLPPVTALLATLCPGGSEGPINLTPTCGPRFVPTQTPEEAATAALSG